MIGDLAENFPVIWGYWSWDCCWKVVVVSVVVLGLLVLVVVVVCGADVVVERCVVLERVGGGLVW